MPLRKLFWILSALTVVFLGLQVLGYGVLEIIISLLILDIAVVEISRQEEGHKMETQLKPELLARIGNVEKLCSNMMSSISALPTMEHMYHTAEEMMLEHKARIKDEIKEDLDRLAKKAVDIENRLFDMRKTVAAGIGSIDDRLRAMETGRWTVSSEAAEEDAGSEDVETVAPASEEVVYGENVME